LRKRKQIKRNPLSLKEELILTGYDSFFLGIDPRDLGFGYITAGYLLARHHKLENNIKDTSSLTSRDFTKAINLLIEYADEKDDALNLLLDRNNIHIEISPYRDMVENELKNSMKRVA